MSQKGDTQINVSTVANSRESATNPVLYEKEYVNAYTLQLNDGNTIPKIGLGVLRIDDESVSDVVYNAIESGYRQIDGAAGYNNECGVGSGLAQAFADGLVKREDLWVTSKIRDSEQGYENTMKAFMKTLTQLKLDYLDMYMIHWPVPQKDQYIDTWKAFEKLQKDGYIRTLGVCNFLPEYLDRLMQNTEVRPAVNQLELHPSFQQQGAVQFTRSCNIAVQAYSPMARGLDLDSETIALLSQKYGKTPAQIILRWHIEQGNIIIPKTTNPSRMRENLNTFDFTLDSADMQQIFALDRADGSMGHDPHTYSYS